MVSTELSNKELEDKLEQHLKGCADKIRNAVDKTDYKDVIIPVVFYKAVSDTYNDEYEEAKEEYGEEVAGDEQFHTFQIPEEYLWENALKKNKKIGQFLNEVFDELEQANPDKLQGAFNIDYAGEQGLDDSRLRRLLQHLDKHNLSAERLPPDVLGKAYMDLVRHFAEEEGRDGGEFFTPPNIVALMVKLLAPFEKGDSFHDPTAGSGGLLIEAARSRHHSNRKN
jgi:type I restriction enzyme M protein